MCIKMSRKPIFDIRIDQLNTLQNDIFSCVEANTYPQHISLHPYHLTNISDSIKGVLDRGKGRFLKSLGGIFLGYKNVKIGAMGPISDDSCFIHLDIEAYIYLYKPVVGQVSKGIINKKSEDHVGCLVNGMFNVSLPKPHGEENWLGNKAQLGQEIQFCITYVELDARLPYIKADFVSILSEDSGFSTSEETSTPKKSKKIKFDVYDDDDDKLEPPATECDDITDPDKTPVVTKHKKTKKKKRESNLKEIAEQKNEYKQKIGELAGILNDSELIQAASNMDMVEKVKSKKSKKRHLTEDTPDVLEHPIREKKKSKKSKHTSETQLNQTLPDIDNIDKVRSKPKKSNDPHNNSDISLPDLNLAELFKDEPSPKSQNTFEACDVAVPHDSELDELIKSFDEETSKKSKKRKRKSDPSKSPEVDTPKAKKHKTSKHKSLE